MITRKYNAKFMYECEIYLVTRIDINHTIMKGLNNNKIDTDYMPFW